MSKMTPHHPFVVLLLLGIAAGPVDCQNPVAATRVPTAQDAPDLAKLRPAYRDDGTFVKELLGTWRMRGYGKYVVIHAKRAQTYSVSKAGAWHSDEDEEELLCATSADGQRARITLHSRVPGYYLERVKELPAICAKDVQWTPPKVFDAFTSTMAQLYPFFKIRGVDWTARTRIQRAKVTAASTDSELFAACEAMLSGLDDGHISLIATIDGQERQVFSHKVDTFSRIEMAFKAQSEIKTMQAFHKGWVDTFKAELNAAMVGGKVQIDCNRKLIWGRLKNNVGYLFITGMGGFADGSIAAQVRALHQGLDEILKKLADTSGMIVDVSLNRGGMDLFSVEIADHFADRKRLGFSKYPATAKDLRLDRYIAPRPGGKPYTKPVFLIIDSPTASAAEIFAMCMRSLPHVTTVGHPTSGALSDILDKSLPNGWEFGMSNEIYLDHLGQCHEGPGVPPDLPMDIFDPKDVTKHGHAEALQAIAARIDAKVKGKK